MNMNRQVRRCAFLLPLMLALGLSQPSAATGGFSKKKITSQSELPSFRYPIQTRISTFLQETPENFTAFAAQVLKGVQITLDSYDIEDKSTLRALLDAELSIQELTGHNEAGVQTVKAIRRLEDKPDARLLTDLTEEAIFQARLDSGTSSGAAYQRAFADRFKRAIDALPWNVTQNRIKEMMGEYEIMSPDLYIGAASSRVQPMLDKTGALDSEAAWNIIRIRCVLLYTIPLKQTAIGILQSYISGHVIERTDIWKTRELTLHASDNLHPVLVGIWDSGVDTTVFAGNLYTDPDPGWHDPHGLAFDDQGGHSRNLLSPLSDAEQSAYDSFIPLLKGMKDQSNGVDSVESSVFKREVADASAEKVREFFDRLKVYDAYVHGTHVAGIVVRGNPAARLLVFRFNDQLLDLPFTPTLEWARRMAQNFREIGDYCRAHQVRVVNMSWGDQPSEFEQWLAKTQADQDLTKRKAQARKLFEIWKSGIAEAITSSPNTLFVCAAGNSDSNVGFVEDVPPALHLPNLIAVGAVDQAGDEAPFTSYGPTILVHADGLDVESYVPGGRTIKLSGTSMASPNVANLAAKLVAINPSLTPEQLVSLIRAGATTSEDGRRHLIDERRSFYLLRSSAFRHKKGQLTSLLR